MSETIGQNVYLTVPEALAMLCPSGATIHTMRCGDGVMMGCDVARETVEAYIRDADARCLAGPDASACSHCLCVARKGSQWLFIETKKPDPVIMETATDRSQHAPA